MTITVLDPFYAGASGAVLVALAVAVVVLRDAMLDLSAVKRLGIGNGRRNIARNGVRSEAVRILVLILILTSTGSRAFRGPSGPDLEILGLIPRLAMIVLAGALAVDAVTELRHRVSLRNRHRTAAEIAEDDPPTISLENDRP